MINQSGFEFINQNSIALSILLRQKKIKKKQIFQILQNGKTEKTLLPMQTKNEIQNVSFQKLYTKKNCYEDFFTQNAAKFPHLQAIYGIVNIDDMINQVVTNPIYEKKRNLYYFDLLIDSLVEEFYDYQSIQFLAEAKQEMIERNQKLNRFIEKNIRCFYIRRITI